MKDAIVKEVRETRHRIEREFDHDVNKYLDHVCEAQKKHGDRLVRRQPKLLKRRKAVWSFTSVRNVGNTMRTMHERTESNKRSTEIHGE